MKILHTMGVTVTRDDILKKGRKVLPVAGISLAAALALAGLAILISQVSGEPLSNLTRDPTGIYNLPFYSGMLSTVGLMLWAAAAAAGFLAYAVVRKTKDRFLLSIAVISLVLGLDDAFLFHEELFPRLLAVPEKAVYLAYLVGLLGWLWYFREQILRSGWLLLALALGAFGLSLAIDALFEMSNLSTFAEDSFKLAGILFWVAYAMHTAYRWIRNLPARGKT